MCEHTLSIYSVHLYLCIYDIYVWTCRYRVSFNTNIILVLSQLNFHSCNSVSLPLLYEQLISDVMVTHDVHAYCYVT